MRCNKEVVPKFYANIKTHKENNPIRPICAFNDSPTYELAKFLSKLLMPITDTAPQKLKNSYEIKDELSTFSISADHTMVSFDVKQLFTSIPIDLAIEAVSEALDNNDLQNTSLNKDSILKLTKLCLQSAIFQFDN